MIILIGFIVLSFGIMPVFGFSGFAAETMMDQTNRQLASVRADIIESKIWDLNQKQCDLRGNIPAQVVIARQIAEKQETFRYLTRHYALVIPCTP
jgi:hypothetical protein